MKNGQDKQVSVSAPQAAGFALDFLTRAPHTQVERERFDIAVGLLQAIALGQVTLTQPQPPQPEVGLASPETTQ